MSPVLAVVLLVAAQRLAELVVARRNTARLLAQGAVEHGARAISASVRSRSSRSSRIGVTCG